MSETILRLDQVSRAMNPFLLFIAVALVVLNLACVVNLIDWRAVAHPPAAADPVTASSDTAPQTPPAPAKTK